MILLPYDKLTESDISKLKEESNNIKVQYTRDEQKINQLVLLVDNKLVLNITLRKKTPNKISNMQCIAIKNQSYCATSI
jgi:hypothetical protein